MAARLITGQRVFAVGLGIVAGQVAAMTITPLLPIPSDPQRFGLDDFVAIGIQAVVAVFVVALVGGR